MKWHMTAFGLGFLLDLLLGDPPGLPHPVRLIGRLITNVEKQLTHHLHTSKKHRKKRNQNRAELWQGAELVMIVLVLVTVSAVFILFGAYRLHLCIGVVAECLMTYQILAVKCLKTESMKVYFCLKKGDLEGARAAVSMIVGRDTACLTEEGVVRAAVETVAENTSDGVIAPMLYLALGGPALGFFYKAVNTMDSMVGYRNETYLYFGRAAAKLDDAVNYIPARISAALMIAAAFLLKGYFLLSKGSSSFSGKHAFSIYKRDRRKHASPNSAQTESVCAGALGIRLAGDAVYFGKTVKKPYIGDALRMAEYEDIQRANQLMYVTAWLWEGLCLFGLGWLSFVFC